MASGTGYIRIWRRDDEMGRIHVCRGDHLVGEDVFFALDGCRAELQDRLRQQSDISDPQTCPPPSGALCVEFDFDLFEGDDIATNVGQLNC
jgi:hypothetical protein